MMLRPMEASADARWSSPPRSSPRRRWWSSSPHRRIARAGADPATGPHVAPDRHHARATPTSRRAGGGRPRARPPPRPPSMGASFTRSRSRIQRTRSSARSAPVCGGACPPWRRRAAPLRWGRATSSCSATCWAVPATTGMGRARRGATSPAGCARCAPRRGGCAGSRWNGTCGMSPDNPAFFTGTRDRVLPSLRRGRPCPEKGGRPRRGGGRAQHHQGRARAGWSAYCAIAARPGAASGSWPGTQTCSPTSPYVDHGDPKASPGAGASALPRRRVWSA